MSKASEWAEAQKSWKVNRPRFEGIQRLDIGVNDDGKLYFFPECRLEDVTVLPEEAVALGRWLIETFGDA